MVPEMMLESRKNMNSQFRKAAVIGSPIKHSKSPLIQNYAIKEAGIDGEYSAIELKNLEAITNFISDLKSLDWAGVNVTIPHKEAIIPYLDEQSENVQMIGACNTIVNKNGTLIGYNTDAEGFYFPIKDKGIRSALILGNGGASKAVLYQCAKMGVKQLMLIARDHQKSAALCSRLETVFNVDIQKKRFNEMSKVGALPFDLIVNTTSVGMNESDAPFDFIQTIGQGQIFYDLIYSPWETKMMKMSKENGAETINGAMMLAHQGALAFELFFNQKADTFGMYQQLLESFK